MLKRSGRPSDMSRNREFLVAYGDSRLVYPARRQDGRRRHQRIDPAEQVEHLLA